MTSLKSELAFNDGDRLLRQETMMPVMQVARVFIASPGDLSEERRLFPNIIDQVNEIKARSMNYLLHAVGWEDALPGFGRPQEIINRDVESCDVFVMLLWKRWGQPTGKFSSGTEEEFNLALERFNAGKNTPHLLLYFRSVPRYMMADPGEQLVRVIKFRTWIEEKRLCMFDTYDKPQDWKDLLVKHLCKWLDTKTSGDSGALLERKTVQVSAAGEERLLEIQKQLEDTSAQLQVTQSKLRRVAVTYAVEAMKFIDDGKFTLAEEKFAGSVELYEEPDVLNNYGQFLYQIGSVDRAKEIFEKLYRVSGEPGKFHQADAAIGLGRVYESRGDTDRAEEMYQRALENLSGIGIDQRITLYGRLGNLLLVKGDLEGAEEIYKKSLATHVSYDSEGVADIRSGPARSASDEAVATSYEGLGNVCLTKGDLDEAEKLLAKALEIYLKLGRKEETATIFSKLGIIRSREGTASKAREALTMAIKLFRELNNDVEVERNKARLVALKERSPRKLSNSLNRRTRTVPKR